MFYIDSFNKSDVPFADAVEIVNSKNRSLPLLDNLMNLEALLLAERDEADAADDIDSFYWNWHYEINAFNAVVANMSKLFN